MDQSASLPSGRNFLPILDVDCLSIRFGGVAALSEISFAVAPGQTCGLIGPNGAGKTTLFNCISGIYGPHAGEIRISGTATRGIPPHRMAALGVGRTFQNLALFPKLSVLENVLIGSHIHMSAGFAETAVGSGRARKEEQTARDYAHSLLETVGMADKAAEKVGSLPFGHQKRIELARAMATRPKLLLLDEPAAGLNPSELDDFASLIRTIRAQAGFAILLVEHHLGFVMALCEKIVVLNFGRKIAEGSPAEVRAHPDVVRAYVGDKP